MRIGIVGLGAVGGFMGARLARSGAQVSALLRGRTLEVVRQQGLTLIEATGSTFTVPINVADRAEELGTQDLIVIAVKTPGLLDVARRIGPMIGPQTTILSAMNGIPWWFFYGLSEVMAREPLQSVDPGGELERLLPPAKIVGSVTHLSCTTPEPGTVRQMAGQGLIVGEPKGGDAAASPRCASVMAAFTQAGLNVEGSRRIQQDIWYKLWGNMTLNPVSILTQATGDRILDDQVVRDWMSACMLESGEIGARIGLPISMSPEERHQVTRKLGALRTSMLQDMQAGRPIELDALLASVIEIGRRVGVRTPQLDLLMGLSRLAGRSLGLYPAV